VVRFRISAQRHVRHSMLGSCDARVWPGKLWRPAASGLGADLAPGRVARKRLGDVGFHIWAVLGHDHRRGCGACRQPRGATGGHATGCTDRNRRRHLRSADVWPSRHPRLPVDLPSRACDRIGWSGPRKRLRSSEVLGLSWAQSSAVLSTLPKSVRHSSRPRASWQVYR
jgi:hypothetical protein